MRTEGGAYFFEKKKLVFYKNIFSANLRQNFKTNYLKHVTHQVNRYTYIFVIVYDAQN